MRTTTEFTRKRRIGKSNLQTILSTVFISLIMVIVSLPASAHCDSYDGPAIKDAIKALETNNVNMVLKWIIPEQEKEIIPLFNKTYALKSGDQEVYEIVEKHFLETLVRLHRETESAPYTGLKPAGTTKQIIQLSDQAIVSKNIEELLGKLNNHIGMLIREKYEIVSERDKVKNDSPEKGREYVEAYIDYTHTIEAIHELVEQGDKHQVHKH